MSEMVCQNDILRLSRIGYWRLEGVREFRKQVGGTWEGYAVFQVVML